MKKGKILTSQDPSDIQKKSDVKMPNTTESIKECNDNIMVGIGEVENNSVDQKNLLKEESVPGRSSAPGGFNVDDNEPFDGNLQDIGVFNNKKHQSQCNPVDDHIDMQDYNNQTMIAFKEGAFQKTEQINVVQEVLEEEQKISSQMDQQVPYKDQLDENGNNKNAGKSQFVDVMSKEQSQTEDENDYQKCNVNDATFISQSDIGNEERQSQPQSNAPIGFEQHSIPAARSNSHNQSSATKKRRKSIRKIQKNLLGSETQLQAEDPQIYSARSNFNNQLNEKSEDDEAKSEPEEEKSEDCEKKSDGVDQAQMAEGAREDMTLLKQETSTFSAKPKIIDGQNQKAPNSNIQSNLKITQRDYINIQDHTQSVQQDQNRPQNTDMLRSVKSNRQNQTSTGQVAEQNGIDRSKVIANDNGKQHNQKIHQTQKQFQLKLIQGQKISPSQQQRVQISELVNLQAKSANNIVNKVNQACGGNDIAEQQRAKIHSQQQKFATKTLKTLDKQSNPQEKQKNHIWMSQMSGQNPNFPKVNRSNNNFTTQSRTQNQFLYPNAVRPSSNNRKKHEKLNASTGDGRESRFTINKIANLQDQQEKQRQNSGRGQQRKRSFSQRDQSQKLQTHDSYTDNYQSQQEQNTEMIDFKMMQQNKNLNRQEETFYENQTQNQNQNNGQYETPNFKIWPGKKMQNIQNPNSFEFMNGVYQEESQNISFGRESQNNMRNRHRNELNQNRHYQSELDDFERSKEYNFQQEQLQYDQQTLLRQRLSNQAYQNYSQNFDLWQNHQQMSHFVNSQQQMLQQMIVSRQNQFMIELNYLQSQQMMVNEVEAQIKQQNFQMFGQTQRTLPQQSQPSISRERYYENIIHQQQQQINQLKELVQSQIRQGQSNNEEGNDGQANYYSERQSKQNQRRMVNDSSFGAGNDSHHVHFESKGNNRAVQQLNQSTVQFQNEQQQPTSPYELSQSYFNEQSYVRDQHSLVSKQFYQSQELNRNPSVHGILRPQSGNQSNRPQKVKEQQSSEAGVREKDYKVGSLRGKMQQQSLQQNPSIFMNQSIPGSKRNQQRINQNSSFGMVDMSELTPENDLQTRDMMNFRSNQGISSQNMMMSRGLSTISDHDLSQAVQTSIEIPNTLQQPPKKNGQNSGSQKSLNALRAQQQVPFGQPANQDPFFGSQMTTEQQQQLQGANLVKMQHHQNIQRQIAQSQGPQGQHVAPTPVLNLQIPQNQFNQAVQRSQIPKSSKFKPQQALVGNELQDESLEPNGQLTPKYGLPQTQSQNDEPQQYNQQLIDDYSLEDNNLQDPCYYPSNLSSLDPIEDSYLQQTFLQRPHQDTSDMMKDVQDQHYQSDAEYKHHQ